MKIFTVVSSLLLSCALLAHAEETRTWTNSKGVQIQGSLISKTADTVTLKLDSGKTAKVPIAQLSQTDVDYIVQWTPGAAPASSSSAGKNKKEEEGTFTGGENYNDPWPNRVSVPVEIEAETVSEEEGKYIYETDHFRFISDAKLTLAVIRKLACVFEATMEANCQLPLNFYCRKVKANPKGHKFVTRLYEHDSDFFKVCSSKSAAGVYIRPNVHVPFSSMGLKKMGSAYALDKGGETDTLIHEITHQMSLGSQEFPIWFSEGIAEYVGMTPYNSGKFNFGLTKKNIIATVTQFGRRNSGGRALGKDISVPPLKVFMNLSHPAFMSDAQRNYGFSTLLAYYFMFLDGKKDGARLKAYLKELHEQVERQKVKIQEYIKKAEQDPKITRAQAMAHIRQIQKEDDKAIDKLLDGRTWEELEKEVQKGMKQLTVSINFNAAAPSSNAEEE